MSHALHVLPSVLLYEASGMSASCTEQDVTSSMQAMFQDAFDKSPDRCRGIPLLLRRDLIERSDGPLYRKDLPIP